MTISIQEQAAAVEISAVNLRAHVENLTDLVARGRRNQLEIDVIKDRPAALEAAAKTLRWLEANGAKIRGVAA